MDLALQLFYFALERVDGLLQYLLLKRALLILFLVPLLTLGSFLLDPQPGLLLPQLFFLQLQSCLFLGEVDYGSEITLLGLLLFDKFRQRLQVVIQCQVEH